MLGWQVYLDPVVVVAVWRCLSVESKMRSNTTATWQSLQEGDVKTLAKLTAFAC